MRSGGRSPAAANDAKRLGRYRTSLDGLGECAIVHRDAGDGAPFLSRDVYEALRFTPRFEALPLVEDLSALGPLAERGDGESMIG